VDSLHVLTRKGATCSDLLTCLYGLKPIEIEVLLGTAKRGASTVDEVAAEVKRDRTTTHRCLSKLASAGLVYRRTYSMKGGGYYHAYSVVEPKKIREEASGKVREITESLLRLVLDFEADFQRRLDQDVRLV
jgi:predicted transcriptional regulator